VCSNDAQSYVFSTGNDLLSTLQLQKTANHPLFATKKASIFSFFHKNSDTVLANPILDKNGVVIIQLKTLWS
jgi:flagellar protein